MNTSTDRRHFLRSAFHAPVRLRLGESDSPGLLHDASLKGALVEVAAGWSGRVGQSCELRLDLAPDVSITMETTVAHRDEGGLVGLHCERLDLDSMTHLRQLVEHNAADPALLERDLATLVRQGRALA